MTPTQDKSIKSNDAQITPENKYIRLENSFFINAHTNIVKKLNFDSEQRNTQPRKEPKDPKCIDVSFSYEHQASVNSKKTNCQNSNMRSPTNKYKYYNPISKDSFKYYKNSSQTDWNIYKTQVVSSNKKCSKDLAQK
jgi:hypothetical protein